MPRSLDPNARLTMVLAGDVDKTPQPKIFGKTLTISQQRKLMQLIGAMDSLPPEQKIDAVMDAAELCLTGWENMTNPQTGEAIAFSREAIGDVLAIDELMEVFQFLMASGTLTGDDKKKSESQP